MARSLLWAACGLLLCAAASGQATIQFTPATLNPFAGFNPATGALNSSGYAGDGQVANSSNSKFNGPGSMAYDSAGNIFIADSNNYVIRRIDHSTGILSTFAGPASFGRLTWLTLDAADNVYVSDADNNVVWKITPAKAISRVAGGGTGVCGGNQVDSVGDGCPATSAVMYSPEGLAFDSSNNLYIADALDRVVRKVSHSTGIISLYAGDLADQSLSSCAGTYFTNSGPGPYLPTEAHICLPWAILFDHSGNMYISDYEGNVVWTINPSGYISLFAGHINSAGNTGNGYPATSQTISEAAGMAVDPAGRVYITAQAGDQVFVVDTNGYITSVVGDGRGTLNNSSIGQPDTESTYDFSTDTYIGAMDRPSGILVDPSGNLLVTDQRPGAITSSGTTGQYYFGSQQIYQTVSSDTLASSSAYIDYPSAITISNPSSVPLTFTGPATVTTVTPSAAPSAFAISGGTCSFPGTIAPGASCTVLVSFTPTENVSYTGTITLDSNANTSPNTINLSGSGTGTCSASATLTAPPPFSGPVNVTSASQAAVLKNSGPCPISTNTSSPAIVNNTPSGSTAFALTSNNCPTQLAAGASCDLYVDFTPTAAIGYSAQLQLNIPGYGNLSANLSGSGTSAPAVSFNPTSITFPSTPDGVQSAAISTVLTNVGTADLTNITPSLAGSNPTDFAFSGTNNCPSTLAPSASCTISVSFTPMGMASYSATISVADNAAGSPQTINLSGTGSAALPLALSVAETIHVSDGPPALALGIALNIPETIYVSDEAPKFTSGVPLSISETIHVSDALPGFTQGISLPIVETIHVSDALSDQVAPHTVLISVSEYVQETDTLSDQLGPAPVLISITENVQETDTTSVGTITYSTKTVLTSSALFPSAGNSVTFTATVTSSTGNPDGSVTFYDGTTVLGSGSLNSNGFATYATTSLSDGVHSITAVYTGTEAYQASTSNTITETVTDFTLTLLNPAGGQLVLTVLPGTSGNFLVSLVPPASGYTGTIALSASGLPPGATASFSPDSLTLGTTAATSTLTITIPSAHAQARPAWPLGTKTIVFAAGVLPFLGLLRGRKRRTPRLLALLSITAGILGLSSCGSPFFTQPQQTYNVTITGTSGTVQHSATITLIVP